MTTWKYTNIDTQHYLNYCFLNEHGHYRTANLRDIYNKFAPHSNIHAVFVRSYNDWCKYWFMGPGLKRVKNHERHHSFFRHLYQFLGADIYRQFDPNNNNDCEICKFNISRIIQIYDDYFKQPEYTIHEAYYVNPAREPQIHYVEHHIHEANYVKPSYIPWEEKYKAIVYKKGHRGAISTWLSHWYI